MEEPSLTTLLADAVPVRAVWTIGPILDLHLSALLSVGIAPRIPALVTYTTESAESGLAAIVAPPYCRSLRVAPVMLGFVGQYSEILMAVVGAVSINVMNNFTFI